MNYAGSNSKQDQQLHQTAANMACISCHTKKRKCDRKKPTCTRCLTNRQICCYKDLYSEPVGGLVESPEKPPTSGFLTDPARLIDRYNIFIHPWLPIIDASRLKARLGYYSIADAEVTNLLLCIHIATQPSSTKAQSSEALQELHVQAQTAFATSQISNKFSIETTQCGLLLAVYQLGAGLLADAYVTLSATAGLARVRSVKRAKDKYDLEERAVWCAIFLLDRLLAFASLPNNLPLLMDQPQSLAGLKGYLALDISRDNKNKTGFQQYEYFCAEIEAAYLAGQALHLLGNPRECRNLEFEEMNSRLTVLLSGLFDRAVGSWRPLCGSMAIIVVANTELQFIRLIESESSKEVYQSSLDTLSIFLGIILDIAENYVEDQRHNPNRDVVPIASVVANYRASLAICREKALGHPRSEEHMKRLAVLKEALEINSLSWGLAETYTNSLTQSI